MMGVLKREHELLRIERSLILTIQPEDESKVDDAKAEEIAKEMSAFLFKVGDIIERFVRGQYDFDVLVSVGLHNAKETAA